MLSKELILEYGVPQGAVLGPMFFVQYMTPLEDIITRHNMNSVIFADDSQLYVVCDSRTDYSVLTSIEACVNEIRCWMRANMLALNDGKTEVVWFSSKYKKTSERAVTTDVRIGDVTVSASSKVRDLGVIVDSSGSMEAQVSSICSAASYSLWRIGKIRKLLDQKMTEKLIHGFVTSRLDYCNSLLFGLPDNVLKKLQLIQNSAARVVTRRRLCDRDHITPVLRELHWLPVSLRINFKILCIIFKVIHHSETAPRYLTEILTVHSAPRSTRSATEIRLQPFPMKRRQDRTLKSYGDRALAVCGPNLWNGLPSELRCITNYNNFKSSLKTHLFRTFY